MQEFMRQLKIQTESLNPLWVVKDPLILILIKLKMTSYSLTLNF